MTAFLGVTRSLKGNIWRARPLDERLAEAIAQKHDLPEILGRVLAARNVGLDDVETYLSPTIRRLMPQPSALIDMEKGASRLATAIMTGERIGIIGDYDVDGLSSTALMLRFLQILGTTATAYIPDRLTEGYGPSETAIRSLREGGASLLLTLDCGVLAHDPLAHAAQLGLETIIVDHHQAGETLPQAHAVINPNRQDDISGLGYLCAAGVVMILIAAVNRVLRERRWYGELTAEPNMLQWLELVALATVCDVVPLAGLNRAYVVQGLKIMARRENPGLAALADVARLKRKPDPYALAFLLGPRLNAAGRIGNANRALELLTTSDKSRAHEIAQSLEALNRERQAVEIAVVDEAIREAEAALGREGNLPVILVAGEGWHPGVLGLAAARLKERFNRPSIVLGHARDAAHASGSGRSIAGADLGLAIRAAFAEGLITKGGGHAMAAGLTMERARLGDLRIFLEEHFAYASELAAERTLAFDGALSASGATLDLVELLEMAGPYGSGNPQPLFAFPSHRVLYADAAGSDHVRCTIEGPGGTRLKAIAFRSLGTDLGERLLAERHHPLHIAARLVVDDYSGSRAVTLHIEDAAEVFPSPPSGERAG